MGAPPSPPKLSPEDHAEVAKLLGDEKWCSIVEQIMADRYNFLQPGQPRPSGELADEVVKEIEQGLERGKTLSEKVLAGKAEVVDLRQWLAFVEKTQTGWFLGAFDRVNSGTLLPVRGSGARGERKTPKPKPLPPPTSFPLNLTDCIPSMAEAAALAQIGRIDS